MEILGEKSGQKMGVEGVWLNKEENDRAWVFFSRTHLKSISPNWGENMSDFAWAFSFTFFFFTLNCNVISLYFYFISLLFIFFLFVLFCFICFMLPVLAITVPRTVRLNRDSNGSLLFWHRPVLKLKRIVIVRGSWFFRSDYTVRSEF